MSDVSAPHTQKTVALSELTHLSSRLKELNGGTASSGRYEQKNASGAEYSAAEASLAISAAPLTAETSSAHNCLRNPA